MKIIIYMQLILVLVLGPSYSYSTSFVADSDGIEYEIRDIRWLNKLGVSISINETFSSDGVKKKWIRFSSKEVDKVDNYAEIFMVIEKNNKPLATLFAYSFSKSSIILDVDAGVKLYITVYRPSNSVKEGKFIVAIE